MVRVDVEITSRSQDAVEPSHLEYQEHQEELVVMVD